MISYLIRSTLCMAVLLLVYLFFLEKEKMHRFNRWYLLGSLVFACIVPLISFTTSSTSAINLLPDSQFLITDHPVVTSNITTQLNQTNENNIDPFALLQIIYALITTGFLIRFIRNIYLITSRAAKNKVVGYKGAKLVFLKENVISHSFLHYIFVNENDYKKNSLEKEILTHELTHVKQNHSLDILFVELIQLIFWFNPFIPFYKRAIQLNHEFLADDAVITKHEDVHAYQNLLLKKVTAGSTFAMASSFNYSITKKRLVMMTRKTSRTILLLKKLCIVPLLAAALIIFSSKTTLSQNKQQEVQERKMPPGIRNDNKRVSFTKEGVSPQLLEEYNGIIDEYIYKDEKGHDRIHSIDIASSKRARMEVIFNQMSEAQQRTVRVGFMNPIKPAKRSVPTQAQLEKWKVPENYGVWIDGKKVSNEKLNNYKPADFSYYGASNLAYNDKARKNIMERYHLKVMYKVQLNLMTNSDYDNWIKESKKPQ